MDNECQIRLRRARTQVKIGKQSSDLMTGILLRFVVLVGGACWKMPGCLAMPHKEKCPN